MSTGENRPEHRDWQNTIAATVISGLILVVVFLCPWRVESTGEIKWSPIYQQPMSYMRSFDDQHSSQGSYRFIEEEAEIAYDILALEVLILAVAGGGLYIFYADSDEEESQ